MIHLDKTSYVCPSLIYGNNNKKSSDLKEKIFADRKRKNPDNRKRSETVFIREKTVELAVETDFIRKK